MSAKASTMWAIQKSAYFLKQQNQILAVQNRKQHAGISEKNYVETVKMGTSKEFPYNTLTIPLAAGSEQEQHEFKSTFPEVVTSFVNTCTNVPVMREYYTELLNENVGKDKQASGFLTNITYKIFEAPEKLTPENIKLANILGWCSNMLFSMDTITDDITDASENRYGKPCWYKRPDVGLDAINDAVLMENGVYLVLKKYFSGFRSYVPIVECFHDAAVKTVVGQRLGGICTGNGKPRLELFSMNLYEILISYKITSFAYRLPMTLGMYFAEIHDPQLHRQVNEIISELGFFFAAQNDMLDCYGDPAITGKEGNDIAEGQCTWLVVKALQQATPAQKEILREHYGRPENESIRKVRSIYDELGLVDEFLNYEKTSFDTVCRAIQGIPKDRYRQKLYKIAESAYEQTR